MTISVTTIKTGKVLEIRLNRPPVNAIDLKTSCDLFQAFEKIQNDPEIFVGIITGAGEKIFSAGWDLKEFVQSGDDMLDSGEYDLGPGGLGGMSEFWGLTKPIIAAVNGKAIGGGFEMLLSADIIIASDHVEFILPEVKLGFLADGGGIQRLPKRIPYNVAAELMLTGRAMKALEAKHYGLVSEVVPFDQLLIRAHEIARQICEGAPIAMQALKEVMSETCHLTDEDTFKKTRQAWKGNSGLPLLEKMLHSEDYLEGSRAFSEKRTPVYKGK